METKTTDTQDGSLMEQCVGCCGDSSKMEEMRKLMQDCCVDNPKMDDMRKAMKDCCK